MVPRWVSLLVFRPSYDLLWILVVDLPKNQKKSYRLASNIKHFAKRPDLVLSPTEFYQTLWNERIFFFRRRLPCNELLELPGRLSESTSPCPSFSSGTWTPIRKLKVGSTPDTQKNHKNMYTKAIKWKDKTRLQY